MKPTIPGWCCAGVLLLAGTTGGLCADEEDIPLLSPEERRAVDEQSGDFQQALQPALSKAAESTVRIWAGKRRLAYGTVVGDGRRILTKWSEVLRFRDSLLVQASGGEARQATVAGVFPEEDLVLLEITGTGLTPVQWSDRLPDLGGFLAAPQPDGRLAAFGVVSVRERNLRESDQAFLGVQGDVAFRGKGVRVEMVSEGSAAEAAGLRRGDVILKVDDRAVSGPLELRNSLAGLAPGARVRLLLETKGEQRTLEATLGQRPEMPSFPDGRLRVMERMGGAISRVRGSFGSAVQTDMRPRPDQIGGPVVNLDGEVVGITLARADRTRSFLMPAADVRRLLEGESVPADLAMQRASQPARPLQRQAALPRPREAEPRSGTDEAESKEMLQAHLDQMRRLLEFMEVEMGELEAR